VWSASVPPTTLTAARRPARTTEAVPCNNYTRIVFVHSSAQYRKKRTSTKQAAPPVSELGIHGPMDHGATVNTQSCISYLDIVVADEMALPVLLQQVKKK